MLSEVGRTGVWYLCRLIYGEPRGVLKAGAALWQPYQGQEAETCTGSGNSLNHKAVLCRDLVFAPFVCYLRRLPSIPSLRDKMAPHGTRCRLWTAACYRLMTHLPGPKLG